MSCSMERVSPQILGGRGGGKDERGRGEKREGGNEMGMEGEREKGGRDGGGREEVMEGER